MIVWIKSPVGHDLLQSVTTITKTITCKLHHARQKHSQHISKIKNTHKINNLQNGYNLIYLII